MFNVQTKVLNGHGMDKTEHGKGFFGELCSSQLTRQCSLNISLNAAFNYHLYKTELMITLE